MANIKSAEKRILVNQKKTAQNKAQKSELNTYIKKFKTSVTAKEFTLAEELYITVTKLLDKAAQDSVIHKNKADRQKAILATQLQTAKK